MAKSKFIQKTSINGLYVIQMPTFRDGRGYFREVFRINEVEETTGLKFRIKQWNHSYSKPGVIRALHAENWNKIVYPTVGKMFSAIADIRPKSKTFGKHQTFQFDSRNLKALFVSKGLANSICAYGNKPVHCFYLVDSYYDGSDTTAIAWDDEDLAIKWPVKKPILSKRDRNNPRLKDMFPDKFK